METITKTSRNQKWKFSNLRDKLKNKDQKCILLVLASLQMLSLKNPSSIIRIVRKALYWETGGITAKIDGNNDVPTLTPLQETQVRKPGGTRAAAIVGIVVAALVVIVILVTVYICLMRVKRFMRQTSEVASSMPSPTGKLMSL